MKRIFIYLTTLFFLSNCCISCEKDNVEETITDTRDGNIYKTVKIGEQRWMAENLKANHYADVTAIPMVEDTSAWDTLVYTDKAFCYYDNSTANRDVYGALYTWAAAMNGAISSSANPSGVQGVCPTGWHVSSDAEWTVLTDYLGGEGVAGGKMKEAGMTHWHSPSLIPYGVIPPVPGGGHSATNESGFTALPGGCRTTYGNFGTLRDEGHWWSSTESEPNTEHAWAP